VATEDKTTAKLAARAQRVNDVLGDKAWTAAVVAAAVVARDVLQGPEHTRDGDTASRIARETLATALNDMRALESLNVPEADVDPGKEIDNSFGMVRGQRYRIIYRRIAGRVYDECVAQYISWDAAKDEAVLSLRPLAGTSSIPRENIKRVEPTEAAIRLPRRSAVQADRLA
jgi:hypothetical protein